MAESWFSGRAVCIPLAALADARLKPRARLVLLALAALAGRDGRTQAISKGAIAACCGLPATNLARELRELEAAGWLSIAHQPGASSVYRLSVPPGSADSADPAPSLPEGKPRSSQAGALRHARGPRRKSAPLTASDDVAAEATASVARIQARPGEVVRLARHGNSWLVSFALDDQKMVSTIFPGPHQPCVPGDTALLDVRDWRGRLSIAGGAAAGVHWLRHHPVAPREWPSIDFVVAELLRYATPSGRVYVSLRGTGAGLRIAAQLPEENVVAGIEPGRTVRIRRRDGAPITWQEAEAHGPASKEGPERSLDVSGAAFVVETA